MHLLIWANNENSVISQCNIAMNLPVEDISWRQSVSWLREQFVSGVAKKGTCVFQLHIGLI